MAHSPPSPPPPPPPQPSLQPSILTASSNPTRYHFQPQQEPTTKIYQKDHHQSHKIKKRSNSVCSLSSKSSSTSSSPILNNDIITTHQSHHHRPMVKVVKPIIETNNHKELIDAYKSRQIELLDEKARLEETLAHFKQVNQELVQKLDIMSVETKKTKMNEHEAERQCLDHFKQEIRKRDELIK